MSLARWVPIVGWLPRYDRSWLAVDAIAGLTLAGLPTDWISCALSAIFA